MNKRLTLLAAAVGACMSAQAQDFSDPGMMTMLYLNKPFGAEQRHRNDLSYGLRLSYGSDTRMLLSPRTSLFDIRLQGTMVQDVHLAGMPLAVRDPVTNTLGVGGEEIPTAMLVGLGVVVGVGVSCATENWPCEDDDSEVAPPPPPPVEDV